MIGDALLDASIADERLGIEAAGHPAAASHPDEAMDLLGSE